MLLYPTVSNAQIVIAPQPYINTSGVASGPISLPNGTGAAPAITFANGTQTGIFSDAANKIAISINNQQTWSIGSNAFYTNIPPTVTTGVSYQFSTQTINGTIDGLLGLDAANIYAFKNGANGQTVRIYGTTTGPKYLYLNHDGTNGSIHSQAGVLTLATDTSSPIIFNVAGANFWQMGTTGILTGTIPSLATTSTDGQILQNTTAATAGVTVQISPRIKWSGTAYNSVSTLSETDTWYSEVLPVTAAGVTGGTLRFAYIKGDGTTATAFSINPSVGATFSSIPVQLDQSLIFNQSNTTTNKFRLFPTSTTGQLTLTNGAQSTGIGIDVQTDGTILFRNTAFNADATIRAASYSLAATTALPADQTGNATATFKMNGLGAAAAPCTITPGATGKVKFTISGILNQSTTADGVTYKLAFGSGTAPANAAAATGTVISAVPVWTALTGMLSVPFSIEATTSGLTVATAYWYDLQIADVTGGTAAVKTVTCAATEN